MSNNSIKLIQLSDCHLLAERSRRLKHSDTYAALAQVCAQIKKQQTNAQYLLLTGDLSQDGSVESYQHLQSLIGSLYLPGFALPGNHDDFMVMQKIFATGSVRCLKQYQLQDWQLICLDTTVSGEVHGFLADEELSWLEQTLVDTRQWPTLVAMHHHPVFTGSQWMDAISLQNADSLLAILQRTPQVKMVVFGHIHQVLYRQINHIGFFGTPSTCHQFAPSSSVFALDSLPPAYRVIELFKNGSYRTHVEFLSN